MTTPQPGRNEGASLVQRKEGSESETPDRKRRWAAKRDVLVDIAFPNLEQLTPEQLAKEESKRQVALQANYDRMEKALAAADAKDRPELARELLAGAKELLHAEITVRQGVEARLATTLGFIALASAIATGVIGSRAAQEDLAATPIMTIVSTLTIAYMVLQLICAGWASISGLQRMDYRAPTGEDLFTPASHDPEAAFKRAKCYLRCASVYQHNNEHKVSQLAVAHKGAQNFLGGLMVLTILATAAIVWHAVVIRPAYYGSLMDRFQHGSDLWRSAQASIQHSNSPTTPPPESNPKRHPPEPEPTPEANSAANYWADPAEDQLPAGAANSQYSPADFEVELDQAGQSDQQTQQCSQPAPTGKCVVDSPFWVRPY